MLVVAEGVFLRVLAHEIEEILRACLAGTLGVVLTTSGPSASSVTGVKSVHHVVGDALVQERH